MVERCNIRTDLALEDKERFDSERVEVPGVVLHETYDEEREIRVTTVRIETENGAKTMRKPVGTYVTIEAPNLSLPDEGIHREVSEEFAKNLLEAIEKVGKKERKKAGILVVGLGNREVTPDALGPYVADNLNITRHIIKEYGKYAMTENDSFIISAIVPGVTAQTGMETAEILKGIVQETKPDILVVIDALAARNSRRLNRTIQIADTGINPGSGVGNYRNAITKETVGVPVIAIGVPTVVDAVTIVNDTMENLFAALETSESLKGVGLVLQGYSEAEKYELIRELIAPNLNTLFMTPKDIDETVKRLSFTISEGLNLAFSGRTCT